MATTKLPAPTNFAVKANTATPPTNIMIAWDPVTGAKQYTVNICVWKMGKKITRTLKWLPNQSAIEVNLAKWIGKSEIIKPGKNYVLDVAADDGIRQGEVAHVDFHVDDTGAIVLGQLANTSLLHVWGPTALTVLAAVVAIWLLVGPTVRLVSHLFGKGRKANTEQQTNATTQIETVNTNTASAAEAFAAEVKRLVAIELEKDRKEAAKALVQNRTAQPSAIARGDHAVAVVGNVNAPINVTYGTANGWPSDWRPTSSHTATQGVTRRPDGCPVEYDVQPRAVLRIQIPQGWNVRIMTSDMELFDTKLGNEDTCRDYLAGQEGDPAFTGTEMRFRLKPYCDYPRRLHLLVTPL